MGLRIIMLVIIVLLFVFIISMLRRKKLELKYCLVWVFALIGIAVLCIFPQLLDWLSAQLGIIEPVNTLFLVCIAFLTCICISLTIVVSRLSERLRKLTQNIAITGFESTSNSDTPNRGIEKNEKSS